MAPALTLRGSAAAPLWSSITTVVPDRTNVVLLVMGNGQWVQKLTETILRWSSCRALNFPQYSQSLPH